MAVTYIVVYVLRRIDHNNEGKEDLISDYQVFTDFDHGTYAYDEAKKTYDRLIAEDGPEFDKDTTLYSANLTKVIESTDY